MKSPISTACSPQPPSTLHEMEMILDLLGSQLLLEDTYKDREKSREVLTRTMNRLGHSVGFGLISPEGLCIAISANIDPGKVKGLHEQEKTKESFARTLTSDRMVRGRVYYFEAGEAWVAPAQATRDSSGEVVGVVATGMVLSDSSTFLKSRPFIRNSFPCR